MTVPNQSKLEYFNSYGLVFDDRFYFKTDYNFSCIPFNSIKRIKIVKGREFKINLLIFLISSLCISFSFLLLDEQMVFKIIGVIIMTPLMISSFLYKKYCYKIVIVTKDHQPISTIVNLNSKEEAKKIVSQVNKKLNVTHKMLEAS